MTKCGDRCPSLMGVKWVSDRAGIDFIEVYVYQKCLLLIQSRAADNSKVLRKKQINLVKIKCFKLSHKLEKLCVDTEKFWTTVRYMCNYLLILERGS